MKRKRLDRDLWGFQDFPYYQMQMEISDFKGLVSIIQLVSGDFYYWNLPKAGEVPVCGEGMFWLQLIPDNKNRVITVYYLPQPKVVQGIHLKCSVSVCYVDIIEKVEYDNDGVACFIDKYLDVIFSPQGDLKIDDKDELDDAYHSGELSKQQYLSALQEKDDIISELCTDMEQTELLFYNILSQIWLMIQQNPYQYRVKELYKNSETRKDRT